MKPNTHRAYQRRIERVVALLERAIADGGELPDLARLAATANFSPFHFHRIYRALAGETIGQTVARLRLLRGLRLLSQRDPVTEAALAVGFETPQAFARAFRQSLGATPSELKREPQRLAQEIERLAKPPQPDAGTQAPLRVEVVSLEPFRLAALRNVGDVAELDQAFVRLFEWAGEHGLLDSMLGIYGVPHDDPRDVDPGAFAFDCALAFEAPVDDAIAADPHVGIAPLQLGGGRYARLRHVGAFDALYGLTDRLLAEWLPESGETLRDAPIHHHYLDDPEQVPEAMRRSDLYLPLQ